MIPIDKGVPVPPRRRGRFRSVYPLAQMEPGDSFFVPADTEKERQAVGSASRGYAMRRSLTFISRTVTENGVNGVRVWRIA